MIFAWGGIHTSAKHCIFMCLFTSDCFCLAEGWWTAEVRSSIPMQKLLNKQLRDEPLESVRESQFYAIRHRFNQIKQFFPSERDDSKYLVGKKFVVLPL